MATLMYAATAMDCWPITEELFAMMPGWRDVTVPVSVHAVLVWPLGPLTRKRRPFVNGVMSAELRVVASWLALIATSGVAGAARRLASAL